MLYWNEGYVQQTNMLYPQTIRLVYDYCISSLVLNRRNAEMLDGNVCPVLASISYFGGYNLPHYILSTRQQQKTHTEPGYKA